MHVHQSHSGVPFREPLLLVDITNKGSLSPGAFYHVGVTTYLIICRKAPYLLKVIIYEFHTNRIFKRLRGVLPGAY
jgi:hypothetical protein